jgi:hypothetical protein
MFHFFSYTNNQPLLDLLKQQNRNLEEILETDALISEAKCGNSELISYLLQPEIYQVLINYITRLPDTQGLTFDPSQSNKDNKQNKYPYQVCELLSADIEKIANYMLGINLMSIEERNTLPDQASYQGDEDENKNDDSMKTENPSQNISAQQSTEINDSQSGEEPPLGLLLEFVSNNKCVNFTLAGYFAKVLRNLFFFKPKEVADYLFGKKPHYVEKMASHIYSDSLSEVLSVIIKLDHTNFKDSNERFFIESRQKIIQKLLNYLNPSDKAMNNELDEDSKYQLIQNSSILLSALLNSHRTYANSEEILKPLFSPESLDTLVKSLQSPKNELYIGAIFQLLNTICEYLMDPQGSTTSNQNGNMNSGFQSILESKTQSENGLNNMSGGPLIADTENFINKIAEELPKLLVIFVDKDTLAETTKVPSSSQIMMEEVKEEMKTEEEDDTRVNFRFGYTTKLFGQNGIKIVELCYNFIRLNHPKIEAQLAEQRFFKILLELFIKGEWNNILHNIILKILTHILTGRSEVLKRSLLEDARLLDFIIQSTNQPDYTLNSKLKNKVRKGYLGHLVKLSNLIEETTDPYLKDYAEKHQSWQSYKEQFLKKSNDNDKTKIGGDPREQQNAFGSGFFSGFHFGGSNNNSNGSNIVPIQENNNENNNMEIEGTANPGQNVDDDDDDDDEDEFGTHEGDTFPHSPEITNDKKIDEEITTENKDVEVEIEEQQHQQQKFGGHHKKEAHDDVLIQENIEAEEDSNSNIMNNVEKIPEEIILVSTEGKDIDHELIPEEKMEMQDGPSGIAFPEPKISNLQN